MFRAIKKIENAHDDSIWAVAFGAGCIVSGSVDETLKVWDEKDLSKPKFTFKDNELAILSVDTSGDGKTAATSSMDGQIRVYDLVEGKKSTTINAGAIETWTIAYHPKKDIIASGTHSGGVNLWDVKSGKKLSTVNSDGKFTLSVAYSPNGALIASGANDGVVNVFDVETGKSIHKLPGHVKPVRGLCFSADSSTLYTASEDNHINSYDIKGGNQISTYSGHTGWVLDVDVNPVNPKYFTSCGADRKVKVWDLTLKECVHTFDAADDAVWSCGWSADGTRIVTGSEDHSVSIFEAKDK